MFIPISAVLFFT